MRPRILQPLTLYLWSLLLAWTAAHSLQDRGYSDKFDNVYYVTQGEWACSKLKLERIQFGIKEAHRLAEKSINVLKTRGSETSPAYSLWFGKSNATPRMVDILLRQHYRTALSHLSPSTKPTRFYVDKVPKFRAIKDNKKPTVNSIVYACPPDNDSAKMCGPENPATAIYKQGGKSATRGPTILGFCPTYFKHGVFAKNINMVDNYRRDRKVDKPSRGFLISKATFPDPPAEDVNKPDPTSSNNSKCYSPECCAKLSDSDKIRNAQNYALFALHVAAFPITGKPIT
ncbi:Putative metallopeptidase, catalytic domain superfamily [Colletotrichum destructivum]|uniref:Metallopeptidase, catalytic domain superfamily n=1 Tax=Colletotrichum destructivum TaxID=34406 RepID=A0AAX4J352_9PEZI|nr:Putative metallopeptidase, catalytic domain superfamily [Colletotrichum destructivum]